MKDEIKKSVKNSFDRVGIPYQTLDNEEKIFVSRNLLSGETCLTTDLIRYCILWVYTQQMRYDKGDRTTRVSDFDRIRYFVLDQDKTAYMTCLD